MGGGSSRSGTSISASPGVNRMHCTAALTKQVLPEEQGKCTTVGVLVGHVSKMSVCSLFAQYQRHHFCDSRHHSQRPTRH